MRQLVRNQRFRLFAAFAAVYLIWGSTYLAIRFAIETIPPYLMIGTRYSIAGTLLYLWLRWKGVPRPAPQHWATAFVVGILMLVIGNGGVAWAEQTVPSGLTALIVAIVPLWVALMEWGTGKDRPTVKSVSGLLLGFAGVVILVGPRELMGGERVMLTGAVVLVVASIAWATGTVYSRTARQHPSQSMATAMSMLAGSVAMFAVGGVMGEFTRLAPQSISLKSVLAVLYLVVFGSLIGFSAFMWLIRATSAARASTNSYVNPVVAVILGWALAGEPMTPRTLVAALVIIAGVWGIVSARGTFNEPNQTSHVDGDAGVSDILTRGRGAAPETTPHRKPD